MNLLSKYRKPKNIFRLYWVNPNWSVLLLISGRERRTESRWAGQLDESCHTTVTFPGGCTTVAPTQQIGGDRLQVNLNIPLSVSRDTTETKRLIKTSRFIMSCFQLTHGSWCAGCLCALCGESSKILAWTSQKGDKKKAAVFMKSMPTTERNPEGPSDRQLSVSLKQRRKWSKWRRVALRGGVIDSKRLLWQTLLCQL